MATVRVSQLTFRYEGSYDNIFEKVSFQFDTDWRLGLVGRNGRGKTTFLRLLMGQEEYEGRIDAAGIEFTYFPCSVKDRRAMAWDVAEEVCSGAEDWQIFRELNLLRVDVEALYRPFETMSSGEQTKVLLAALFLRENSFPLIDEPTNHLDAQTRTLVGQYLRQKRSFLLVSHDRTLLDSCTDHVLSINRCNIEIQKGNFSSWMRNKEERDRFELEENQRLKGEIGRLERAARQTADWSDKTERTKKGTKDSGIKPDRGFVGHKAAKMMKRSKSIESRRSAALEEKARLLKNIERSAPLKLSPLYYHKERLALLRDVSVCCGTREVCRGINLEIKRGDRIRLKGANGCGKSSLLKALLGENSISSGTAEMGAGLKISYVAQDTSFLQGSLSDFADTLGVDETLMKTILRKLDFDRVHFEKDMQSLSQGQKKKVLLAASLAEQAHLYLWDEPLNYIDVFSRMQIEELLLEYEPTMVFVEHDDAFGEKIATAAIELP